jgi:ABC-2 type transport system permease protein
VRLPADFTARLAAGAAPVQVIVHGAEASRASIILNYVTAALEGRQRQRMERAGPRGAAMVPAAGSVTVEQRMWFNAANTSTWYLVPGLVVLIMTLVGAFLTALVMAREWERGTLEALFVTPVRPVEILLAKIIPYFAVGLGGLALCLLAARFLFGVPMQGSLALVLLGSMLYLFVAVGLGLLISSVTKNQFIASQVALLASFMPSLMLSGFLFDLRNVPVVVRILGNALPATYFMELLRTLFLAGNVWPLVLRDCAVLAGYAVLLLGAARLATKKSLD